MIQILGNLGWPGFLLLGGIGIQFMGERTQKLRVAIPALALAVFSLFLPLFWHPGEPDSEKADPQIVPESEVWFPSIFKVNIEADITD